MNNAVFLKIMERVRKHRDTKLVTTEKRRNYLLSEPNYRTTNIYLKIQNHRNEKKPQSNRSMFCSH